MKISVLRWHLRSLPQEVEVYVRNADGQIVDIDHLLTLYREPALGMAGASVVVLEHHPREQAKGDAA